MNYVLATSRRWNEPLAGRLSERTGRKFHLISEKEQLTLERLRELSPRFVFFPHWSFRIPEVIFDAYECVIFHMTDLPYGRGGSPLQNLLLRGHSQTQISALRCVSEVDAGPIYMKRPLDLAGSAAEIFHRATLVIENMINEIVEEEPVPTPQKGEIVQFDRRKPAESNLTVAKIFNLREFYDFIRMLDADGYPKAFIELHGHRIEFSGAKLAGEKLVGTYEIKGLTNKQKSEKK